ncbi:MAG: GNAT family N-acetyltransferase [Stellaceae bacterium]
MNLPPGCRLTAETQPSGDDVETLGLNLDDYNRGFLGETGYARLALFVRGTDDTIRAGLDSAVYANWLYVALLWVHADLRRQGIGRSLLGRAEAFAAERGCHSVRLDTFSFQAPGFYRKQGYAPFGSIAYPPDHQRIFLQKLLTRG